MEETAVLLALVFVMLVGSFLAGSIPLFFTFSEDKLKKISVFGAGLLVGTALAVIIPEGVRSLIPQESHGHGASSEPHIEDHKDPLSVIGISLVLGFIFMLLVDQISQSRNENVNPLERRREGEYVKYFPKMLKKMGTITLTLFSRIHNLPELCFCCPREKEIIRKIKQYKTVSYISQSRNENVNPSERNITATVGLVVHAAADGVALGAAATTSHADVEIIVFLAIMLHKAPAAFGLVTFLLHEGIESQIPSLTDLLLIFLIFLGIAMLFSAGTFLYVATVHVLADITQGHEHSYDRLPQSENSKLPSPSSRLKSVELLFLVVGCMCPLLLSIGHHH
uniref:Zinc transporter ZIP9 n=1 Tax=Diabrotica virgifera virgifera TaxID=50390 RepID=A0A6P7FIJ1_DIAVI